MEPQNPKTRSVHENHIVSKHFWAPLTVLLGPGKRSTSRERERM